MKPMYDITHIVHSRLIDTEMIIAREPFQVAFTIFAVRLCDKCGSD